MAGTSNWSLQISVICGNVMGYQAFGGNQENNPRCPCGKAVLGGGAQAVVQPPLAIAPEDPACPSHWVTAPKQSGQKSITCGNVPGYEVVSTVTNFADVTDKEATAQCPPGKVVLSGGAKILGDTTNKFLLASAPIPAPVNGWKGKAYFFAPQRPGTLPGSWALRVDAICAQ